MGDEISLGKNFSAETNTFDEDAAMMKYIEVELAKKKGYVSQEEEDSRYAVYSLLYSCTSIYLLICYCCCHILVCYYAINIFMISNHNRQEYLTLITLPLLGVVKSPRIAYMNYLRIYV